MSDYTNTFGAATKDATSATITATDIGAQFDLIATAVATKTNKIIPATSGNVATLSSAGDLQDSGVGATNWLTSTDWTKYGGNTTITPASDADITLTADQALYGHINLNTGSWLTSRNIIVPADTKLYWINNQSIYTATVKTAAGTGIAVPPNSYRPVYCDSTNVVNPASELRYRQIIPVAASVSANALTLTLNPSSEVVPLEFRNSSLTNGTTNYRFCNVPITVTVSSGSTLGTINAVQARLAILAIDNSGTIELAVVNTSGGIQLDETNLISTTAEGGAGAADSASVIYSTTARSNVPYRVVGFIDITEATAGTWATSPTLVQGAGGMAFILSSSPKYTNVAASRSLSTTYYNDTGYDLEVSATLSPSSVPIYMSAIMTVDGNYVSGLSTYYCDTTQQVIVNGTVPAGSAYAVNGTNATKTFWYERRRT